jgi:hypothetical protein
MKIRNRLTLHDTRVRKSGIHVGERYCRVLRDRMLKKVERAVKKSSALTLTYL